MQKGAPELNGRAAGASAGRNAGDVTRDLDLNAIRRAAERHGVAKLALFGSVVTGGFTIDSDVDFLVDFLPGRTDPFEDYSALREELVRIVGRGVDLVVNHAIRNPYFRDSALVQAETVYAANV